MVYHIGLMLRSEEIGAAVEAWPVGLFGLVWKLIFYGWILQAGSLQPVFGLAILDLINLLTWIWLDLDSHFLTGMLLIMLQICDQVIYIYMICLTPVEHYKKPCCISCHIVCTIATTELVRWVWLDGSIDTIELYKKWIISIRSYMSALFKNKISKVIFIYFSMYNVFFGSFCRCLFYFLHHTFLG